MLLLIVIGIIPALLVLLAGRRIRLASPPDKAEQNHFLYLVAVEAALLLIVFLAGLLPLQQTGELTGALLMPAILGAMAAVLTRLKVFSSLKPSQKGLVLALGCSCVVLFIGIWSQTSGVAQAVIAIALPLAFVWILAGLSEALAVVLSLFLLVLLAFSNHPALANTLDQLPTALAAIFRFLYYSLPAWVVALAAAWVTAAFRSLEPSPEREQSQPARTTRRRAALRLALAVILLGSLAYTIGWATLWDKTSDGIAGIWFATATSLAAVGAGVLIELAFSRWGRSISLGFMLLVLVCAFGAFFIGYRVSYHALTEGRAARIQRALERFHQRTSRYPQQLGELVPGELLWVPGPVVLQGTAWCYQGGQDYYRLGAFYREHFSAPLSIRIYASAGTPPVESWRCDQELITLKALYGPQP